jgi:hypothetical protein
MSDKWNLDALVAHSYDIAPGICQMCLDCLPCPRFLQGQRGVLKDRHAIGQGPQSAAPLWWSGYQSRSPTMMLRRVAWAPL